MNIPQKIIPFLWHFVKQQWFAFFIVFITAIIWAVNDVLFPYFIKLIVNAIHDFKGSRTNIYVVLFWPLIALVSCWMLMELSARTQGFVLISTFPKFRAAIRRTVYDYVKQHSHEYFSNNFAGSLAQKISSLPTSCQTIMEILCFNFSSIVIGFIISLVLMWLAHPLFAYILLTWFIFHMGITCAFLRIGNKRWEAHSAAVTTLSGKVVDSLTNILNVRLFSRAGFESRYLQNVQHDEMTKAKSALRINEIMRIFQGLCGLALMFSMIFLLIHGWVQGWITLGDFTLISMLSFWVLGMTWYISYQLSVFVREVGTIKDALSLVTRIHDIKDSPHAKPLKISQSDIQFTNVNFAYQNKDAVFENLNVTIPAGQKVGLVGFSGSGKSTFVNLILRFYDIQKGQILISGQNIAEVTQQSLREQIAMIPQDPTLFHRTLKENIHYGRLDATEEEIIAAAKLAHCHEFIEKLAEGYDSLVGERGIKLSGGQRQRISIARAILKNSPVLILDEATSSLDSVTEKLIQESLQQLMENKTTIVIAHRLSTLAQMDRILVFDKGKIIEEGTQEELLKLNGHFACLWNMQMDGFFPENKSE